MAKLRHILYHTLECVDMTKPFRDIQADHPPMQDQQSKAVSEVHERADNTNNSRDDSSNPEWCHTNKDEFRINDIEDDETEGEDVIKDATMPQNPPAPAEVTSPTPIVGATPIIAQVAQEMG